MKLRMYNVGFGDCFLIHKDDTKLLIDIGTISFRHDNFNNFNDFVNNLVVTEFINCKNQAILTHLHKDHYEGFNCMKSLGYKSLFEKFYVPCITYDSNIKKYVMLEMAYYMYLIFGNSVETGLLGKRILSLVSSIDDITKMNNIESLYRDKYITFEGREFKILWPPLEYKFDDELLVHLEEIESEMRKFRGVIELKEKIIANIVACHIIIKQKHESVQTEALEELIKEQNIILKNIDELRESIDFRYFIQPHNGNINISWYRKICHSTTRIFNKNCNALSVVFQDVSTSRAILMTGDITYNIIDNYLQDDFYDKYHCIKAPHHGTKSHYSTNLPKSENFFISTGVHDRNGKISTHYKDHGFYSGFRICSYGSSHCEIIYNQGTCINPVCKNMIYDLRI